MLRISPKLLPSGVSSANNRAAGAAFLTLLRHAILALVEVISRDKRTDLAILDRPRMIGGCFAT